MHDMKEYLKGRKPKRKMLYAIYDRDELPVLYGSAEECCEYLGISKACFFCNVTRHVRMQRKYYAEKIGVIEDDGTFGIR